MMTMTLRRRDRVAELERVTLRLVVELTAAVEQVKKASATITAAAEHLRSTAEARLEEPK